MSVLLDGIGRKFDPVAVATLKAMVEEGWRATIEPRLSDEVMAPATASEVVWAETFV